MSFQTELTGIVLSASPVDDYNYRMVVLTKERGKIIVFAKGARKPTSSFLACSQPFAYGKFNLYQGREAYNLNGAVIEEYFAKLRDDIELVYTGMYFCELAMYYTVENQKAHQEVDLLYNTLKAMTQGRMDLALIRSIYELKMASICGEAPLPGECVVCHGKEEIAGMSFIRGGCVCREHKVLAKDFMAMVPAAIYAVYYVMVNAPEKIYSFRLDEQGTADFINYVNCYMKRFVGRRFTSLEFLSMMCV